MDGENSSLGWKISMLAGRQFGHVTREQLLRAGLGRGAIEKRLRTGRLIIAHPGVYAVEYRRREPIARAMAAVLACGDGAVLSHESAAALWGMLDRWPDPSHVTVPGARATVASRAWNE